MLAERKRLETDTLTRIRFETQRRREFVQQFDVLENEQNNIKIFHQNPIFIDTLPEQNVLA